MDLGKRKTLLAASPRAAAGRWFPDCGFLAALCAVSLCVAANAHAGTIAADKSKGPATTCIDTIKHRIIARDRAREVGQDILIRGKPGGACVFKRKPGDLSVSAPEGADYVQKAIEPYLFIDSGTGALRNLTVYDMRNGKTLVQWETTDTPHYGPSAMTLWITSAPATRANCLSFAEHERMGGSSAIERQIEFRYADASTHPLAQTRCAYRE